ncbi:MAG TPA: hypothetical protein VFY43_08890 [Candidatus Limnocylindria bacterium]|nr:hypothetical protein [Candidatus Limnocylindria bacterium]
MRLPAGRLRFLLVVALAVAALAVSACSAQPSASQEPAASALPTVSVGAPSPAASQDPSASPPPGADLPDDELLRVQLTDVRSGEHFTLADLAVDGPVLLEPMAVWCTNCRAQMHQVTEAHAAADFLSVSLDVDLSETAADLAAYADREGWDWRFAMANADLYRLLQQRFGDAATYPPATPLIVIERDGTVRPLDFGVGTRSAQQLVEAIGAG